MTCARCSGTGWLPAEKIDPVGYHERAMRGFGDDTQYQCPDCDGTGEVPDPKENQR